MDGGKRILLFVGGLLVLYIGVITFSSIWNSLNNTGINQLVGIFPILMGIIMIALSFINPQGSAG
jgi:multisubunit Na+/H+ antiporter MnhG subunit